MVQWLLGIGELSLEISLYAALDKLYLVHAEPILAIVKQKWIIDIVMREILFKVQILLPFLESNGIVKVGDNFVEALFKHGFPQDLALCLSFVGYHGRFYQIFHIQMLGSVLSSC